jgi:hypothetical protein
MGTRRRRSPTTSYGLPAYIISADAKRALTVANPIDAGRVVYDAPRDRRCPSADSNSRALAANTAFSHSTLTSSRRPFSVAWPRQEIAKPSETRHSPLAATDRKVQKPLPPATHPSGYCTIPRLTTAPDSRFLRYDHALPPPQHTPEAASNRERRC